MGDYGGNYYLLFLLRNLRVIEIPSDKEQKYHKIAARSQRDVISAEELRNVKPEKLTFVQGLVTAAGTRQHHLDIIPEDSVVCLSQHYKQQRLVS